MKRAAEAPPPRAPPPQRMGSPRATPSLAPSPPSVPGVLGDHYDVLAKVGEGTYGSVYKAVDRRDRSEVAIKRMKNTREGEGISHTAYREIALVRELHHPNIVSLKEIFLVGRELNLVFEFVAGDLAEHIKLLRESHNTLSPSTIRYVMRQATQAPGCQTKWPNMLPIHCFPDVKLGHPFLWQLLDGLGYLHRSWIMHRDISAPCPPTPAQTALTATRLCCRAIQHLDGPGRSRKDRRLRLGS